VVQTAETVLWSQVIALPFVLGAFMFYSILFRARLVPRWVSVGGLVGAVLYVVAPLASMLGQSWDVVMAPLGIQEMFMAVWLIAKGFSHAASTGDTLSARAATAPLLAA
jgi:hypothetical protein